MNESSNELLQTVVRELSRMRASVALQENVSYFQLEKGGESGKSDVERMRHEWLLGRFSGLSEAIAYVEGVVEGSNLSEREEGQGAMADDS